MGNTGKGKWMCCESDKKSEEDGTKTIKHVIQMTVSGDNGGFLFHYPLVYLTSQMCNLTCFCKAEESRFFIKKLTGLINGAIP